MAPDPLKDGEYTVALEYNDEPVLFLLFRINIDSSIDEAFNLQELNITVSGKTLLIKFYEHYSGKMEKSITIYASILEEQILIDKPEIQRFSGTLIGNNQRINFTPKSVESSIVEFEFKILNQTNIALGLLLAISFLWLTELIPMAATSLLIPIIITLFEIDSADGALKEFSNPTVFLFLGGFLMAIAMHKSKLDEYIALKIISITPANSKFLLASFMALAAVFSMFMSNTAATAILITIALQLLDSIGIKDQKYKKTVILGIAYAATVGGIATLIGTPPNIIAVGLIEKFDPSIQISFLNWFMFGLPVVIIMLPLVFIQLLWRFKPDVDEELFIRAKKHCKRQLDKKGRFNNHQKYVSIIFVLVLSLWMTSSIHHVSTGIIALIGAVALYFTGIIKQEDMNKINWNALITFGGGLTLGTVILRTGLADWFAMRFSTLQDLPAILIFFIIGLVAIVLTQIASNTASAAILIPVVMPLAVMMDLNPIVMAIMVAILCSMDFAIYIGSPPVLLAYSTGIFKVKDIFNTGILLDIVGLILVVFLSYSFFGLFILLM